ncbi:MAG: polysaccharide biosynthesis/export family protein [Pseudomonadales bacterium]
MNRPAHTNGVYRLSIRTGGCLFFSVMLALAVPSPVLAEDEASPSDGEIYRIGVPDLLDIRVWEQPELSGTALVRTDGRISVPLVGDMVAEGRTPEELAALLAAELAEYVTDPKVDVAVLEMRSQVVSVIGGGIVRSGVLELRHEMRVLDAIAEMGGFTPFAKKSRIKVLRKSAGAEDELPFDYTSFVNGRAPGSNFLLKPGDTIIVPE